MSTRSNKGIWLLLVEPLDLERVIHKSKRPVDTFQAAIGSVEIQMSIDSAHPASIDTVHPTSIDTAHPTSVDTAHPTSVDTAHPTSVDTAHPTSVDTAHLTSVDTAHLTSTDTVQPPSTDTVQPPSTDTVHPPSTDIVHPPSTDTVHPPSTDTVYPPSTPLGAVIPDVIDVAETNNFDLNRECYDWGSVDPFRGLPHQDPRDLIKEHKELASASEQNEEKIKIAFLNKFLYEATSTREKEKNDKLDRFLALLDEEYMIPIQLLDDIMPKRDEQHVSGELS
ncbi:hypothetical protein F2Q69_00058572 [Brassica cretica]|uniref:Uncharacterized protein n=1 Tax=Brassica cretica TaxID=69181 RepID=A0A8S9RJI1_BRACR|nr:hypothetical protein F2Q69_00058572 [Brassica cretica]